MQPELLPLFPLAVVLFPRTQLPLHIFEDRYKEMIGEAIQNKTEVGIVLSSEKGFMQTGCSALIGTVTKRYPDGRLDVLGVGSRRFRIVEIDHEKPYLRGSVIYFNDEDAGTTPPDLKIRAIEGYRKLREFLREEPVEEPKWQDPQVSFQLAQLIPDVEFRQQLLKTRSEAERIGLLADFFPHHLDQRRQIRHIRTVAPTNGHGPHRDLD